MKQVLGRLTFPIYAIAASILVALALVGWTLREDYQHDQDLKQQRRELIEFLRVEVCGRLLLRDQIQLRYLTAAVLRYQDDDPEYASQLQQAVEALQFSKDGCVNELPE